MENSGLTKLANRIRHDDLEAYRQIFDAFYYPICLRINSFLSDFEISRDLAQDLFVKLWNDRERLPEFQNIQSYLYRVSKNMSLNHLSAHKTRQLYAQKQIEKGEQGFDLNQDNEVEELSTIIKETIVNLPEKTRTIYNLHKAELHSQAKVAKIMGISLRTVESHIALAKGELKKSIEKFHN